MVRRVVKKIAANNAVGRNKNIPYGGPLGGGGIDPRTMYQEAPQASKNKNVAESLSISTSSAVPSDMYKTVAANTSDMPKTTIDYGQGRRGNTSVPSSVYAKVFDGNSASSPLPASGPIYNSGGARNTIQGPEGAGGFTMSGDRPAYMLPAVRSDMSPAVRTAPGTTSGGATGPQRTAETITEPTGSRFDRRSEPKAPSEPFLNPDGFFGKVWDKTKVSDAGWHRPEMGIDTSTGLAQNLKHNYQGAKDWLGSGTRMDTVKKVGMVAGAYAGANVGLRELNGGGATYNNRGERDIAGIPFI